MPKKEYWRKCKKCAICAHYEDGEWKGQRWESCHQYGYRLWPDLEPADDCEGYESHSAYAIRMAQEAKKKRKKQ